VTHPPGQATFLDAVGVTGFFADPGFDFAARCVIGYAAQGVMDIGQVFATLARVTDGDADSWHTAWRETARTFQERARAGLAAGHVETARRLFLSASESYAQAIAFSDGQTDPATFAPTFALQSQCWEAFIDACGGHARRVAVAYEGTTLPGFLFRPETSGDPRPTLIMTNGSEGSKSGLWAWGVGAALARGWNAFIYDGPGQQTMLFDQGHPFRPDWEAVLTPVVDCVMEQVDVDASALFAYGCSQAGYWLGRALAFEHRFVAAAVDPGVMDVSSAWLDNLPPHLVAALKAGDRDTFNAAMTEASKDPEMAATMLARGRPFIQSTPYDTVSAVLRYTLDDVIGQIRTPLFITDPDEEVFWPGQSRAMYDRLTGDCEIVRFTRDRGANWHCQPLARQEVDQRMCDFFQDQLSKTH